MRNRRLLDRPMPYIALNRNHEYFIFRYEKGQEARLISTLIDCAENDELNFTWTDVVLILRQMKV